MNLRHLLCSAAGIALATGCAHAPPAELKTARATYMDISRGEASQYAPVQLHEAEKALNRAELAYREHGGDQAVKDYAYVATRKAEIAQSQARLRKLAQTKLQAEQALRMAQTEQSTKTAEELARLRAQLEEQEQARQQGDQQAEAQRQLSEEQQQRQAQLDQKRQDLAEQQRQAQLEQERQARTEAEQRAKEAEARAEQVQTELQEVQRLEKIAKVQRDERGVVLTLSGSLLFRSGRADLLPTAEKKLDEVAQALKADEKQPKLRIEGHTDSRGPDDYNQQLSMLRARTVRDYLESRGLRSDRFEIEGFGEARPVADNASPEGRANNRRVEIVLVRPPLAPETGVGGAGGAGFGAGPEDENQGQHRRDLSHPEDQEGDQAPTQQEQQRDTTPHGLVPEGESPQH